MAIITTDNKHYTNIADKIREKTNGTEIIFPNEMADKVEEVYQKGVSDGEKSEYDRFWDNAQNYGEVSNNFCINLFSGKTWNDNTFKPKYNIKANGRADNLFAQTRITDLKSILEKQKVTLDMSECTNFYQFFYYSDVTKIPTIDASNATSLHAFCETTKKLEQIDKLIVTSKITTAQYAFYNCLALKRVIFEGELCCGNLNMQYSTLLDKESLTSIVNTLSASTTGLTVTLSLVAVNNAFETSTGLADGSTSQEWLDLVATKSNWTIALA